MTDPSPHDGMRVAKRIAQAGLCSRREAEQWVAQQRVSVNGETITSPALNVTDDDDVRVDGEALPGSGPTRLWLYHKKRGLLTTHKDPQGRPTLFDQLPAAMPRVISVGRLDMDSEGLILLTTSGALARTLELPASGWIRRYRVRMFGTPKRLERLKDGITIDGMEYGSIHAEIERSTTSNSWVIVSIKEGKNREIRKVFEHLGHPVSRLIRVAYGPFQLGSLSQGHVKEVTQKVMKEQLGKLLKA